MKSQASHLCGRRAFVLIELMVSTAVVALTGVILYYVLLTGLTLYTKNTAINMAHQEARAAVLQMEQELHASVSIPELTDINRNALSGNGPSAGISFQLWSAGPFQITPSTAALNPAVTGAGGYSAGQNKISVRVNGYVPVVGQRLIIPEYQIEMTIIAVGTTGGTDCTLTLGNDQLAAVNLPMAVTPTLASQPVNIVCFITDRVSYVVNGTQLYYYGRQSNGTFRVLANSLTSPTPFSIPVTPLGAPFNRFVAAINLITADTSTTNLQFRAANMFLNSMEPCRARLCIYQ